VARAVSNWQPAWAIQHAIAIDTHDQAARFNRRMLNACARANAQHEPLRPGQLHCAIVGAGATGVELSAELHKTMRDIAAYGLDNIDFDKLIRLTIIEAGPRVLPALPDHLARATLKTLQGLGIGVRTGERVTAVTPEGLQMASGEFLPAELIVWAAGIKAPDFGVEYAPKTPAVSAHASVATHVSSRGHAPSGTRRMHSSR
jgi:NADH:ubiquinone reductase (H+-translocating)